MRASSIACLGYVEIQESVTANFINSRVIIAVSIHDILLGNTFINWARTVYPQAFSLQFPVKGWWAKKQFNALLYMDGATDRIKMTF